MSMPSEPDDDTELFEDDSDWLEDEEEDEDKWNDEGEDANDPKFEE